MCNFSSCSTSVLTHLQMLFGVNDSSQSHTWYASESFFVVHKSSKKLIRRLIIINKQNCHIWGTEDLHAYFEKLTHRKRVGVYSGFWFRGIIRPFFCEWPLKSISIIIGPGDWQYLALTGHRYVPHSRSYTRCFCAKFLKIALSAAELTTSWLQFDTVGLLFVGCRHR